MIDFKEKLNATKLIREQLIQQILALPEMQDEKESFRAISVEADMPIFSAMDRNKLRSQIRQKITTLGEV